MLESSHFDAVNTASFSFGAFVDRFFCLSGSAKVTGTLTEYVDLIDFLFRYHKYFEWTKTSIELLVRYMKSFIKVQAMRLENIEHQDWSRRIGLRLICLVKQLQRLGV